MSRRLRLREMRERRLMTQEALSQKTGITPATISRIESGQQVPRFGTIRKLAEALGVAPDELIDWGASTEDDKAKAAA